MKNTPLITIIATLVCISFACQNVVFTEPQPAKVSSENNFPQDWQGIFKSIPLPGENGADNAWIKVTDSRVFLFNSRLDSVPFLEGDYLNGIAPEIGDSIQVMLRGDMVDAVFAANNWARFTTQKTDTLGLGDSLILKLSDNWAFLNMPDKQHGKQYWNGIVIEQLRNRDLLLWTIEDGEEETEFMSQFFDIEEIEDPGYAGTLRLASPKKKEFSDYVKSGGFPDLFMWLSQTYEYEEVPHSLK